MRPHRCQLTRLHHPWDSQGKNTGVGCHFLLSVPETYLFSCWWAGKIHPPPSSGLVTFHYCCCLVTKSSLTLCNLVDCSPPGFSVLERTFRGDTSCTFSSIPYLVVGLDEGSAHIWWDPLLFLFRELFYPCTECTQAQASFIFAGDNGEEKGTRNMSRKSGVRPGPTLVPDQFPHSALRAMKLAVL